MTRLILILLPLFIIYAATFLAGYILGFKRGLMAGEEIYKKEK